MRNIYAVLCVHIRTRAAVWRGGHLALNPCSEVGDPAVDSVLPCKSALLSKACVTDKDVLGSALVGQRTARVSLPEIFGIFQKIFKKYLKPTWQLSWPSTPPAQIMSSVIVAKLAMAVVQVSFVTTGTSNSIKTSGDAPPYDNAPQPRTDQLSEW